MPNVIESSKTKMLLEDHLRETSVRYVRSHLPQQMRASESDTWLAMMLEDILQLDQAHLIGPKWEDNVGATYKCKVSLCWPNMLGNVAPTQTHWLIQRGGGEKERERKKRERRGSVSASQLFIVTFPASNIPQTRAAFHSSHLRQ